MKIGKQGDGGAVWNMVHSFNRRNHLLKPQLTVGWRT